jgi:hypothetical protein
MVPESSNVLLQCILLFNSKIYTFELTYGIKHRLPYLPILELTRVSYGREIVGKHLQLLKKARAIAPNNSMTAEDNYKAVLNAKDLNID